MPKPNKNDGYVQLGDNVHNGEHGRMWGLKKGHKEQRDENHSCWKDLPVEKILSLYQSGLTVNKIATIYSVSWTTIQKRLNLFGGCNYAL
jgi:hypothetical protein